MLNHTSVALNTNQYFKLESHLKWTLSTHTVTHMESVTRIMVNNRYLPSKGTAREVGGIISANSKKNTVRERRIDTHNVTFSPESEGR